MVEEGKSLCKYGTKYILHLKDELGLFLTCKERRNQQESANILVPGLQSQETEWEQRALSLQ